MVYCGSRKLMTEKWFEINFVLTLLTTSEYSQFGQTISFIFSLSTQNNSKYILNKNKNKNQRKH